MKPTFQRLQEEGPPKIEGTPLYHDYDEDFTTFSVASLIERLFAFVLDVVLYSPISLLVNMPFNRKLEWLASFDRTTEYLILTSLLWFLPFFAYFLVPTALWGQTLGKSIVGLRVIRADYGAGLLFPHVLLRETIGKVLLILTLGGGVIVAAYDPQRRMLHDRMAKSLVVSYRRR